MKLAPGTRLGPYEIVAPIGAGGMGEVYSARDTRLGRTVAVKILPEELASDAKLKSRFEREAKAISALNHPHICALYDVGPDYLVMEYCEGKTLALRIATGSLPLTRIIEYGIEIADALEKAHRAGIIHRDLKPSNIMITKTGVKLLDFGLAKQRTDSSPEESTAQQVSEEGKILGTIQYMAPEVLHGREADARSDIFALGLVLYEMAARQPAFRGTSKASLIAAILEHEPPRLESMPPLDRLIRACLVREPDERIQSANDVKLQLRWLADDSRSQVRGSPRRWKAASVAVLSTLAVALVALLSWRAAPDKRPLLRLAIPLPYDPADASPIAISPDGTRVVMPFGGKLWLRRLDSAEAVPLTGGELLTSPPLPFWSPDGKFIAFFANNKLKKIAAEGGPVETICDVKAARGGTWAADGTILFAPDVFSALYRVSERGGTPGAVTALDPRQREGGQRWPSFLPDGRHFLYTRLSKQSDDPDRPAVMAASLDAPAGKLIVDNAAYAFYAPPGWLIFTRQETPDQDYASLMAVRFDARAVKTLGAPIALPSPKIAALCCAYWAVLSVSANGTLAFAEWTPPPKAQMQWVDGDGKVLGNEDQPALYRRGAALSPDGKRVAVVRDNDLWLHDVGSATSSRFTFRGTDFSAAPRWSADGNRLYYAAGSGTHISLFAKSLTGAPEEQLYSGMGLGGEGFDVSPDGRFVLIGEQFPATKFDIMIIDLATRRAVPWLRTPEREYGPAFSPDGKWIVYSNAGRLLARRFPDTGEQWQVTDHGPTGGAFSTEPRWSRDGKSILYVEKGYVTDHKGALMKVPVSAGTTFQAGTPRKLFTCDGFIGEAPDGKRFLVSVNEKPTPNNSLQVVMNWPRLVEGK